MTEPITDDGGIAQEQKTALVLGEPVLVESQEWPNVLVKCF